MTAQEIFNLAIKVGMENDLRGKDHVQKHLDRIKEKYDKMSDREKEFFDTERLTNPYSDTRIHNLADSKKEIKKVLVGIDIGGAELLLAKQLGDIDLVIEHHPNGKSLVDLSDVMSMQAEILAQYGVPINIAESLLKPRISEVSRSTSPSNHSRSADMAKILGVNYMNIHTPCDNLVAKFLYDLVEKNKNKLEFVGDVMDLIETVPEYREAKKTGAGPTLFSGGKENYCGKIAITEITGGTEGTHDIYQYLSQAGIGTVIGMHQSEKHIKEAKKAHINALIAGHMSSDSIGVNLFLHMLEKQGIEIVTCSGVIRHSRNQK